MMDFQKFSRAAVVVSALAATAPICTNLAAADETPALNDKADAEVINGTVNTGSATGNSTAGIGFSPGDLVLYQVPNFDFGKNHKFAATLSGESGIGLVKANSVSTRGVVILDNRSSDSGSPVNWTLSVKATAFKNSDGKQLNTSQLKLHPTLATATQPSTANLPYTIGAGTSTPSVNIPTNIVVEANSDNEETAKAVTVANSNTDYAPAGALALSFIAPTSVGFYVGQSDISNITSGSVYKSTLTWTLSTDATNNG
ncbi:MAG: WxL domain-containing protein [Bombilactobacillus mellifer]|uniref:WxL domain-containing protein n=1 Tax=Bombilactobacillus mellifer TaxID=1218492 RepID=UPI0023EFF1BA|nr:WxL domain-containing protein [Bombilactobacillus mellifer]MCT6844525.1 WxL domain-containing protein [Bombilactobacillus mellifer]